MLLCLEGSSMGTTVFEKMTFLLKGMSFIYFAQNCILFVIVVIWHFDFFFVNGYKLTAENYKDFVKENTGLLNIEHIFFEKEVLNFLI